MGSPGSHALGSVSAVSGLNDHWCARVAEAAAPQCKLVCHLDKFETRRRLRQHDWCEGGRLAKGPALLGRGVPAARSRGLIIEQGPLKPEHAWKDAPDISPIAQLT